MSWCRLIDSHLPISRHSPIRAGRYSHPSASRFSMSAEHAIAAGKGGRGEGVWGVGVWGSGTSRHCRNHCNLTGTPGVVETRTGRFPLYSQVLTQRVASFCCKHQNPVWIELANIFPKMQLLFFVCFCF